MVSIHAPTQGATVRCYCYEITLLLFQSTPPMQGATDLIAIASVHFGVSIHAPYAGSDTVPVTLCSCFDVSIHAPYAGSDSATSGSGVLYAAVSIHAPYAGSDSAKRISLIWMKQFQSTPPMQGATVMCLLFFYFLSLFQSTPPMQGATSSQSHNAVYKARFNPRPLCRERHI